MRLPYIRHVFDRARVQSNLLSIFSVLASFRSIATDPSSPDDPTVTAGVVKRWRNGPPVLVFPSGKGSNLKRDSRLSGQ